MRTGETFGRYRIEKWLASGGMGDLFVAVENGPAGFERRVVIKRILPHLARNETFVQRFLDEARIVAQLQHGNIVPVFETGVERGEYYIAMEYLPGWDLKTILDASRERGEPIPIPIALMIGVEVARGLAYAHRKEDDSGRPLGIIHRDVSPSNILVGRDGVVKITDFGIAKAAGKLFESVTGMLQGKFPYMSPEQAAGLELDRRSDVFSLGVVLWEALTGRCLFDGDSDTAVLRQIQTLDPPPPSLSRPEVPEALDEVILKALRRDRRERYQVAEELEQALNGILVSRYTGVGPSSLVSYLERLFPEERKRTPVSFDDLLAAGLDGPGSWQPGDTASTLLGAADAGVAPQRVTEARSQSATGYGLQDPLQAEPPGEPSGEGRRPVLLVWGLVTVAVLVAAVAAVATVASRRPATLEVTTRPGGAWVWIDGVVPTTRPTPASGALVITGLPPRDEPYRLSIRWPGYPPVSLSVRLEPGETRVLDMVSQPELREESPDVPAEDPEERPSKAGGWPPAGWSAQVAAALARSSGAGAGMGATRPKAPARSKKAVATRGPRGWVAIRCVPWGTIGIGGKTIDNYGIVELPVGRHVATCVNPVSGKRASMPVEVEAWPRSEATDHTAIIRIGDPGGRGR